MSTSMSHCPQTGSPRGGDFSSSQVGKHLQNNASKNRRARTGTQGDHTNAAKQSRASGTHGADGEQQHAPESL